MNTEEKNLKLIKAMLQPLLGKRLMNQVLCVLLLIFGTEEKKIRSKLGVSYNTVKRYASHIENGNLEEVFEYPKHRPKSELEDYREIIMTELDKTPARTLREASVIIERVTGLKRSLPQIRNFLKKTDIGH